MNMIESRMDQRGQGGFTLIELLVVIAILAVLAGAAIIGIGAMRDNAKQTACKSEVDTIETALEAYDINTNTTGAGTIALASGAGLLKKVDAADWVVAYAGGEYGVTPAAAPGKYAGVACP
ncbi:MAG: prepilin-type N-terminal cleavage/methylation domain-containing protein [Microthrixaceae bacterium]|nr:prepilin-type N-terminal cleavage/methylation domain-containing protein [Microthrixaceae bacterium]